MKEENKLKPNEFEAKWQKVWEKERVYQPDLDRAKKPYYNLMMFPYPSAEGLHVGNMYAFTGADIFGRFKRMQGNDVFEPIGLDGFGIHSENYAIKVGKHPSEQAKVSAKNFYRQLHAIGNGFAWENTLETYDPDYYKWTQWIFVQMFKKGLAYRKKSLVNFCPSCKTVLSDEQVIDGKCERCKSEVLKREMEQWFFRITAYAEKLLQNTYKETFKWTEKVKTGQRNWIGKKEGINIDYRVVDEKGKAVLKGVPAFAKASAGKQAVVTVFTTRPDTNYGATFVVLAPEHPFVNVILNESDGSPANAGSNKLRDSSAKPQNDKINEIKKYVKLAKSKSDMDRIAEGREKTGVFTGFYAINQLTLYKMPIYVTDFVLGHVGTGAVVGVPGHDLRDFEFAQMFNLQILRVVVGSDGDKSAIRRPEQVQEKTGLMINSDFLNGKEINQAIKLMMDHMEKKGWGKRVTTYKLRDWCISRQRYWGAPIPMIYCSKCKWNPVPEEELPVLLPPLTDWKPEGTGKGPLAKVKTFVETKCPKCGGKAERETDVCDTFLDSSWYHLRYPSIRSAHSGQVPWDPEITKKWLPVTQYIGGAEHTVLHLLYARFIAMVFRDMGKLKFEEPYTRFYAHGLIIAEGAKMSKSRGNIIIPDIYINKYGADTLRIYLMFLGPFNQGGDFRDTGIAGMYKFLSRVWRLIGDDSNIKKEGKSELISFMHKTIKAVTEDLENFRYNTAIAHIMEYVNELNAQSLEITKENIKILLLLLAPFAPHMAEELWHSKFKKENGKFNTIHLAQWPEYEAKYLIEDEVTIIVQVNGKLRDTLTVARKDAENRKLIEDLASKSEKIKTYIEGKKIKKVIYISAKLVNFVF